MLVFFDPESDVGSALGQLVSGPVRAVSEEQRAGLVRDADPGAIMRAEGAAWTSRAVKVLGAPSVSGVRRSVHPRVKKTLGTFGIPENAQLPPTSALSLAALAFANSDLAFQGNRLFMGNFYGMNIYDISNPASAKLLTSIVCPGGQGDVSVHKNLMFMSVEMPNGRLDCGEQAFPPQPAPAAGQPPAPDVQKERFRGVRIFDISDISNPKQVAAVQRLAHPYSGHRSGR